MDCFVIAAAIVILGEELCSGYGITDATTPSMNEGSISRCVCSSVISFLDWNLPWQYRHSSVTLSPLLLARLDPPVHLATVQVLTA